MANIKLQSYEDNKTKIIYAINQLSTAMDSVQSQLGGTGATIPAPTTQVFTSGSGTYHTPSGAVYLEVTVVGGGAGGTGGGNGGVAATASSTTFGPATANGGQGANYLGVPAGGAVSGCTVGFTGGAGQGNDWSLAGNASGVGGAGGANPLGGGGMAAYANAGQNGATNTGAGGGGGGCTSGVTAVTGPGGGAGGYGILYITNPAVTYPYAVGAGSNGGAAASGGYAGGNGAAGIIVVREYYAASPAPSPSPPLTDAPSDGNYYLRRNGVWVAVNEPTASGYLSYASASQLQFTPYNGDRIKVNGVIYQIPPTGITGLGNTGVFVNGVAGQNLTSGTYYVYVFNNGGTPTADFSPTGYAVSTASGNAGTIIKSGDDTRTLIGIVYAQPGFADSGTQRFVRSWFNRRTSFVANSQNWGPGGATVWTATGTYIQWTQFANDTVVITNFGYCYNNVAGVGGYIGNGLDTSTTAQIYTVEVQSVAGGYWEPYSFQSVCQSEGIHTLYNMYQSTSGALAAQTYLYGIIQQ